MLLTLASQSPRRQRLLTRLGIELIARPANADETPLPGEAPLVYVRRMAASKAEVIEGEIVLAADTAVVLDEQILGKPVDGDDAKRMLRQLSGRSHTVLTGICVRRQGLPQVDKVVASEVRFVPLSDAIIDWYVGTGEPLDKAGAYAIQGAGGAFVREISGSVSNVVGLPLTETLELLGSVGFPLPWEPS